MTFKIVVPHILCCLCDIKVSTGDFASVSTDQNYLHIVLVVFVVVVLFVAVVVVVVVVFVVDVAVFFVWQFQQIKIICTYLASLSLFPLLF